MERIKKELDSDGGWIIEVSAAAGDGICELKEKIAAAVHQEETENVLVRDLLHPSDIVVLVVPVDSAAPKGRLILPQQQVIRDILEAEAVSVVVKENGLKNILDQLKENPRMVITDSQAFGEVAKIVPRDIPLTSFSILMARYKGYLDAALRSIASKYMQIFCKLPQGSSPPDRISRMIRHNQHPRNLHGCAAVYRFAKICQGVLSFLLIFCTEIIRHSNADRRIHGGLNAIYAFPAPHLRCQLRCDILWIGVRPSSPDFQAVKSILLCRSKGVFQRKSSKIQRKTSKFHFFPSSACIAFNCFMIDVSVPNASWS